MKQSQKQFLTYFGLVSLYLLLSSNVDAVPVDTLRAPMQAMKKEVWSYMFPIKVASVVVGAAFSLMRQSMMPFGVGAGITAAIHFFDSVLGDGSAALI